MSFTRTVSNRTLTLLSGEESGPVREHDLTSHLDQEEEEKSSAVIQGIGFVS